LLRDEEEIAATQTPAAPGVAWQASGSHARSRQFAGIAQSQVWLSHGRNRAADLFLAQGQGPCPRTMALNPIRYAEMLKEFFPDHGSIMPKQFAL
jgi:hypothetical protein